MTTDQFDCTLCDDSTAHPFVCNDCGHIFCADHYDPEDHYCDSAVLALTLSNGSRYELPVDGWRKRLLTKARSRKRLSGTLTSMVLASPVTSTLLLLMWVWLPFQFGMMFSMGVENTDAWSAYFVLDSAHIEYVWTWLTSILSHGGVTHLVVNSFVLAMFGPFVERRLGPWRYLGLFVIGGVLAGLFQVGVGALVGEPMQVVGASGAIAAVLGVHTTVEPDVNVRLFFVIPVSMWVAMTVFLVGSFGVVLLSGVGAFGVAHLAHAGGTVVGLSYGLWRDTQPLTAHLRAVSRAWERRLMHR